MRSRYHPSRMWRFIICLFLIFPPLGTAQPPESFFPSQVGNLWQYSGDVGTNTDWSVSRDSVAPDGSRILFHVYPSPYGELPRYRIDTLSYVYEDPSYWQGGLRTYKLDADSGEVWVWYNNGYVDYYGWLYEIVTYPVFGIPTTVKVFRLGPLHPDSGGNGYYYHERHLASGFGLVLDQGEPAYSTWLKGCVINGDTFGILVSVRELTAGPPSSMMMLYQNYPNPFNCTTTIEYEVAELGFVRLRVFDAVGREVRTLAAAIHGPGRYMVRLDGSSLSSGIYICRSESHTSTQTKRMLLIR